MPGRAVGGLADIGIQVVEFLHFLPVILHRVTVIDYDHEPSNWQPTKTDGRKSKNWPPYKIASWLFWKLGGELKTSVSDTVYDGVDKVYESLPGVPAVVSDSLPSNTGGYLSNMTKDL